MMVENQTKPNHAQLPTTAPEEKKKKKSRQQKSDVQKSKEDCLRLRLKSGERKKQRTEKPQRNRQ